MASAIFTTSAIPSVDPSQLTITRLRALRGPNYWRLSPVIACDLRLGPLEALDPGAVPGCLDGLFEALPGLRARGCDSYERPGWPHLLAQTTLELQSAVAPELRFYRTVRWSGESAWWVIVEYHEEQVGLEAVRRAADLLRAAIAGAAFDVPAALADLRTLYDEERLGPSTTVLVEEARRRGIPVRRIGS